MEWRTPIAEEARARGISPVGGGGGARRFGPKVVPSLVDLVAHYGFASPFDHNRGLETREVWLAGSALFLVRRIGLVTDREIARLQKLVGEFVERDRRLRVASTLAENAARVLHELRPRRFPPTVDGPAHLQAAQPRALPAPPRGARGLIAPPPALPRTGRRGGRAPSPRGGAPRTFRSVTIGLTVPP